MAYRYEIDDPEKNRKRTMAFALVVAIHALALWALASGLGAKVVQVVMADIKASNIEDKIDKEEPPPPPPDIDEPPPYVPPVEVSIESTSISNESTAISNATTTRPVAPPPVAAQPEHQVVRTPPSGQGRGARITQPEFPPAARRAGESGTVVLAIYVKEDGRPGEVKIAKSSGSELLDQAALKEVQRNWRLVPGKEDGKPVAMWYNFAVTFKLTD